MLEFSWSERIVSNGVAMEKEDQISRSMRSNKSKDTKPELILRKELWRRGLRYRKNCKSIFGTPDVAFIRAKIAVFADGQMWHGYDWDARQRGFKSNREYWIPKIEGNMKRDRDVNNALERQGWLVMRFWDFEITKDVVRCADDIEKAYKERMEHRNEPM